MPISVQILTSTGCRHGPGTTELVRLVLRELAPDAEIEALIVDTVSEAERLGFPGSPTVRVDGVDIDPGRPAQVGLG